MWMGKSAEFMSIQLTTSNGGRVVSTDAFPDNQPLQSVQLISSCNIK